MHPVIQSPHTVGKSAEQSSYRSNNYAAHRRQSQFTVLNTLTHMSVQHDSHDEDTEEPVKQKSLELEGRDVAQSA